MMRIAVYVCLVLGLSVTMASADILIDHFEEGAVDLTRGTLGTSTSNQVALATVLGNERYMALTVTSANPPSFAEAEVYFDVLTHKLVYTNGSGIVGTLEVVYGNTTPLNADFTGESFFVFRILNNDQTVGAHVTFTDSDSSSTVDDSIAPSGATPVNIPLSSFTGIDFSDIQKISVKLDGPAALDMEIDGLGTVVPLPASLLLGLVGLGGLPVIRRLRRNVAA